VAGGADASPSRGIVAAASSLGPWQFPAVTRKGEAGRGPLFGPPVKRRRRGPEGWRPLQGIASRPGRFPQALLGGPSPERGGARFPRPGSNEDRVQNSEDEEDYVSVGRRPSRRFREAFLPRLLSFRALGSTNPAPRAKNRPRPAPPARGSLSPCGPLPANPGPRAGRRAPTQIPANIKPGERRGLMFPSSTYDPPVGPGGERKPVSWESSSRKSAREPSFFRTFRIGGEHGPFPIGQKPRSLTLLGSKTLATGFRISGIGERAIRRGFDYPGALASPDGGEVRPPMPGFGPLPLGNFRRPRRFKIPLPLA